MRSRKEISFQLKIGDIVAFYLFGAPSPVTALVLTADSEKRKSKVYWFTRRKIGVVYWAEEWYKIKVLYGS